MAVQIHISPSAKISNSTADFLSFFFNCSARGIEHVFHRQCWNCWLPTHPGKPHVALIIRRDLRSIPRGALRLSEANQATSWRKKWQRWRKLTTLTFGTPHQLCPTTYYTPKRAKRQYFSFLGTSLPFPLHMYGSITHPLLSMIMVGGIRRRFAASWKFV